MSIFYFFYLLDLVEKVVTHGLCKPFETSEIDAVNVLLKLLQVDTCLKVLEGISSEILALLL